MEAAWQGGLSLTHPDQNTCVQKAAPSGCSEQLGRLTLPETAARLHRLSSDIDRCLGDTRLAGSGHTAGAMFSRSLDGVSMGDWQEREERLPEEQNQPREALGHAALCPALDLGHCQPRHTVLQL